MKRLMLLSLMLLPLTALGAANDDHTFMSRLAMGGNGEIEMGKLAQSKGNSQAVKDFGAMMVKDHTAGAEQLKALAATKNVHLPAGVGAANRTAKTKLDMLSGETFDKSYIANQVKAHKDTLALLQKEISSGQDADAKALAQKLLPTIQQHMEKINSLAANAGVKH
ncbi:MAG: DUF4142 domain-containing protein [Gammaproteobacteria bacterium]|nr:DUF4142 domain-containing protein [Gammaproteobacteria bacterium]